VRNASVATRLRAWFLRTFKGRSAKDAGWSEELPTGGGPPQAFILGALRIDVVPRGPRSAGAVPPALVYEVSITRVDDPRTWSSRYGFPPQAASARLAADAALDELDEIFHDPAGWRSRVTEGMTEAEAEAMEDSPAVRLDVKSAAWIGVELTGRRDQRRATGSWVEPPPA
jgi:hypothetical protein